MKADLDIHKRYSVDGCTSPDDIGILSRRRGLRALAITDRNAIDGATAMQAMPSIPVIVGQEVSAAESELLGLFLREHVPRGLSAMETPRLVKQQGGLGGVAHIFDRFSARVSRQWPLRT